MFQTSEIWCVKCEEPFAEVVSEAPPLQVNCVKCQVPGIFQEMGADPENKTNLFSRGFDTNEPY